MLECGPTPVSPRGDPWPSQNSIKRGETAPDGLGDTRLRKGGIPAIRLLSAGRLGDDTGDDIIGVDESDEGVEGGEGCECGLNRVLGGDALPKECSDTLPEGDRLLESMRGCSLDRLLGADTDRIDILEGDESVVDGMVAIDALLERDEPGKGEPGLDWTC